jgi:hypothetical protein
MNECRRSTGELESLGFVSNSYLPNGYGESLTGSVFSWLMNSD